MKRLNAPGTKKINALAIHHHNPLNSKRPVPRYEPVEERADLQSENNQGRNYLTFRSLRHDQAW
jgi:hypothetical protein